MQIISRAAQQYFKFDTPFLWVLSKIFFTTAVTLNNLVLQFCHINPIFVFPFFWHQQF